MKSLLRFIDGYRKEAVLAPLLKLLEASFELIVPLVMARIIDTGIAGENRPYIYRMCGLLLALAVVGLAVSLTAQWFAAKASTGFSRQLRHCLFAHIQELSCAQTDRTGTDTLITRMTSDVNQVQNGVNLTLRLLLRSPFIVLGAMLMAFAVDPGSAWLFAVVIPVLGTVISGIMLWTIPRYRRVQENLDAVTGRTQENLTGARVIRAFGREPAEITSFSAENDALAALQQRVGAVSGLMNPLTYILVNFSTAALIWTGAVRVDAGLLTQGQIVALLNYMSQILVELIKLANLIIQITRALACAGRIADILAMEPDMKDEEVLGEREETPPREASYAVELRNVFLTYAGASGPALREISFAVRPGETIGIIGGTGSGKTSLISLIPRFYDATQGEVLVDGRNVRSWRQEELRAVIGVVPQKAELFRGTIAENLSWGKDEATRSEMREALAAAQALEFVEQKPGGTDFVLEQNGRNLSGGQRQRLTIARALIRKPRILILDDSASALDFLTDAKLRRSLREWGAAPGEEGSPGGRLTTFIVSQRAASVRDADRILVLEDGCLAGNGTHVELMKNCAVYREIYESQFPDGDDGDRGSASAGAEASKAGWEADIHWKAAIPEEGPCAL